MPVYRPRMDIQHDIDPRRIARGLYFAGYRVARIAEMVEEKPSTIHSWKRRDKWDESDPVDRVALSLEARLVPHTTRAIPFFRPAAIAVHDDSNVLGDGVG